MHTHTLSRILVGAENNIYLMVSQFVTVTKIESERARAHVPLRSVSFFVRNI